MLLKEKSVCCINGGIWGKNGGEETIKTQLQSSRWKIIVLWGLGLTDKWMAWRNILKVEPKRFTGGLSVSCEGKWGIVGE